MASTENTTQLPLDVKVSAWSSFRHNTSRFLREFRYSSLGQVVGNIWFWVDGSFAIVLYWFVQQHQHTVSNGRGVILVPASVSSITTIQGSAVMWLSLLPYIAWGMMGVWVMTSLVAVLLHGNGRPGIVSYVFILALVLLVLLARTLLFPVILLGG